MRCDDAVGRPATPVWSLYERSCGISRLRLAEYTPNRNHRGRILVDYSERGNKEIGASRLDRYTLHEINGDYIDGLTLFKTRQLLKQRRIRSFWTRSSPDAPVEKDRDELSLAACALGTVAGAAEQLQVVQVVGPATDARNDVIDGHVAEREQNAAARAVALLFSVERVPVRPVVRKLSKISTRWRVASVVDLREHAELRFEARLDQRRRERGQVDADPLAVENFSTHARRGTSRERIKHNIAFVSTGADDSIQ